MTPDPLLPKVEQSSNVRIITFTSGKVRELDNILGDELKSRMEGLEGGHLLLDFTNVSYITSVELGSLITLHKRMRDSGGRLILFNLTDEVYEVFTATSLHTVFSICRQERQIAEVKTGNASGDHQDCSPTTPPPPGPPS